MILSSVDAVEFYNLWMDIGQQPPELKVSESYIELIIVSFLNQTNEFISKISDFNITTAYHC